MTKPTQDQRVITELPRDEPWALQPQEDLTEYNAFLAYLHADPPRTIRKACEVAKKAPDTLWHYSQRLMWVARARAYDAWIARCEAEAVLSERLRLRREHMRALAKVRTAGELKIDELLERDDLGEITARDALAYLKEAITAERLIIGEATERVEQRDWEYDHATPEQLDRLEALYEEIHAHPADKSGTD
ncbi:MAG: hypothetical protein ACYTFK_13640 [Planctomycetota bacterium]